MNNPIKHQLEIRNLTVRFKEQTVLDIEKMHFDSGTFYAVIGHNGAGKSTLFKCLTGLLTPTSGEILFKGEPLGSGGYPGIGIILQRPVLFAGSVLSNVEFGLKCRGISRPDRRARAENALEQLGVRHLMHKNRRQLSGGELQRIAIARTLALDPDVLLMDEPFTYLDPNSSMHLVDFLRAMRSSRKRTLILATHELERGYALADEVFSLEAGRLGEPKVVNILRGNSRAVNRRGVLTTTEGLELQHTESFTGPGSVFIDPSAITIAREQHVSTARNQLSGTLSALIQESRHIRAEVETGVTFSVYITLQSCRDLNLQIGDTVWLSFKASSVRQVKFN